MDWWLGPIPILIIDYLNINFTYKLTDEFNLYLQETYYDLDLSNKPQEIQDKAKEVIKEKSDLGKFVHTYMTYDLSYSDKN